MKRFFLIPCVLFAFACAGGGSGGNSPAPVVTQPSQKLEGSYVLEAFTIQYQFGGMATQSDFTDWSGELRVSPTVYNQIVSLENDDFETIDAYQIFYDAGTTTSGMIQLQSGDECDFGTIGNKVSIAYYGTLLSGEQFFEEDIWKKVSDGY